MTKRIPQMYRVEVKFINQDGLRIFNDYKTIERAREVREAILLVYEGVDYCGISEGNGRKWEYMRGEEFHKAVHLKMEIEDITKAGTQE